MRKKLFRTLSLIVLLLAACDASASYQSDPYADRANADATRAAASARLEATQQTIAEQQQQATLSAARTQGAALAEIGLLEARAQATQQALDIVLAIAQATQEAERVNAEGTLRAGLTQQAAEFQAAQTSTAYPPTATVQALAMNEIARQDRERQLRAQWQEVVIPTQAIAPTVFLALVCLLLLVGTVLAYKRFAPVAEARGRAFKRGPHDAPLFALPVGNRVIILDPDRAFGPALLAGPDGVISSGHAPTPELQAGVTLRDQAVDALRALPRDRHERKTAAKLIEMITPQALPQGMSAPQIEILDGTASPQVGAQVGGWLDEVERKLLTDGESEP
jgi:hypothetical protein